MSLASLINTPCTITHEVTGTSTDRDGNAKLDEVVTEAVCEIQQFLSAEPADAGETSVADYHGFFLAGTVLATGDKITVEAEDYEVVGDPWRARNPLRQAASHIEAHLRRASATLDEVAS